MTMFSLAFRSVWCWTALVVLLLSSCDSVEFDEQPQVTVRILQSEVTDGVVSDVSELAVFEVPVPNNLRRDSAFAEALAVPEGDPIDYSFGVNCSGRSRDFNGDIVFWFVENSGSDETVFSGVSSKPCVIPSFGANSSTSKRSETSDGTFYAFSVEGLGGTSTVPLRLSVGGRGSSEESTFEYQPERHQLPAEHLLLHFDETAVGAFLPLEEASGFTIEVTGRGVDLDERALFFALATPIPTYGTVNGIYREGSTISWQGHALSDGARMTDVSSKRSRITYLLDRMPDELDFYLVALGEQ